MSDPGLRRFTITAPRLRRQENTGRAGGRKRSAAARAGRRPDARGAGGGPRPARL